MKKIALLIFTLFFATVTNAQDKIYNLIIGTYTNSCESKGIYVYDFSTDTGDFALKATTENVINPSYLTVSEGNDFVYSVNENGSESTVSSFGFNSKSGKLNFLNKQNTHGADPCYIINDDKNVISANYSGGTISVFGKNADGSLTEAQQIIQHSGKSVNEKRQESAHVHMVYFSPDKKFVLANDLGLDKILIYKYDKNASKEILTLKETIDTKKGSGPRHLVFSNDGKFVYVLHELDGSLTTYKYKNGSLKLVHETTIEAKDFKGETSSADIHISPNGKFLYATNRGDANTINTFAINKKGSLDLVNQIDTKGKGPRNFVIDPTGKFLLIGHQYTNNVVIFKIDKITGKLTDTGKRIELCSPVCLVFSKQ
ncbi:lactonase family protein [Flavobacterium macacae]|uniref:Lactonase family protein n=1 Tax=Flavobacterium macacae TaxID=2488993 RepID=A0A3P3W8D8_9FLAO|nr:lactonase family protein [Flavobacterium macacae]RRJ91431.1 lactonase family protein [Flavobacterium macacae]